jgi:hypothetical protein
VAKDKFIVDKKMSGCCDSTGKIDSCASYSSLSSRRLFACVACLGPTTASSMHVTKQLQVDGNIEIDGDHIVRGNLVAETVTETEQVGAVVFAATLFEPFATPFVTITTVNAPPTGTAFLNFDGVDFNSDIYTPNFPVDTGSGFQSLSDYVTVSLGATTKTGLFTIPRTGLYAVNANVCFLDFATAGTPVLLGIIAGLLRGGFSSGNPFEIIGKTSIKVPAGNAPVTVLTSTLNFTQHFENSDVITFATIAQTPTGYAGSPFTVSIIGRLQDEGTARGTYASVTRIV